VGTIEGGEKVNLTVERARAEVDLRLPVGSATDEALAWVEDVVAGHSGEISVECLSRTEPTYTDPDHPLLRTLRRCAVRVQGRESNPPPFACGFGFTTAASTAARGSRAPTTARTRTTWAARTSTSPSRTSPSRWGSTR